MPFFFFFLFSQDFVEACPAEDEQLGTEQHHEESSPSHGLVVFHFYSFVDLLYQVPSLSYPNHSLYK